MQQSAAHNAQSHKAIVPTRTTANGGLVDKRLLEEDEVMLRLVRKRRSYHCHNFERHNVLQAQLI